MKLPDYDALNTSCRSVQSRSHESRSVVREDSSEWKPMSNQEHMELVVKRIADAHIDITSDDKDYSNILLSIANEFGESGRDYVHKICQYWVGKKGKRYDYSDVDSKYDWCVANCYGGNGIGTFMAIAKDYGVDVSLPDGYYPEGGTPPVKPVKSSVVRQDKNVQKDNRPAMIRVGEFLKENCSFRYNVITCCIEVLESGSDEWKRLDDRIFKTIYTRLKKTGIKTNQGDVEALINSIDYSPEYNPVQSYFGSLPKWDPETSPDAIAEFFDHIIVAEEDKAFCMHFTRKWFLCFVALMLGKITENQLVLMLVSPQNAGKTVFCRNILPPELRDYFHLILPEDKFDKDQLIALSQYVLILLDEFKINPKSSNLLKAIISSSKMNIRSPYARFSTKRNRLASFIGAGNDEQYIADAQGDRRYITIKAQRFIFVEEHPLPYEMAYAQALYLINQPDFVARLLPEELAEVSSRNEEHLTLNICHELIKTYFRKPGLNEKGVAMSRVDIYNVLLRHTRDQINLNDISKAMKDLKYDIRKPHNQTRYYVYEIPDDELQKNTSVDSELIYHELCQQCIDDASPEDVISI